MAAGIATLFELSQPGFMTPCIIAATERFVSGMVSVASDAGVSIQGVSRGGMFGLFFRGINQNSFAEVTACDEEVIFKRFFHLMLNRGIYLAPSIRSGFCISQT